MGDSPQFTPRKIPRGLPTNMKFTTAAATYSILGNVAPPNIPEVRSGRGRIDQLSSPRHRAQPPWALAIQNSSSEHGTDYKLDFKLPQSGLFGAGSPRQTRDERTVFEAGEKMHRRVAQHPSGEEDTKRAELEWSRGRGVMLPPADKVPTAVELLTSLKSCIAHNQSPRSRLAPTAAHGGAGIAGLLLARSARREDQSAIRGTKLQLHELTNTEVPMADMDADSIPTRAVTSGRRNDANNISVRAPEPAAVRSLAISGIDTSRTDNPPAAPSYFHGDAVVQRTSRHGNTRLPNTFLLTQPSPVAGGQYVDSKAQFDAHTRGLHNASSYILEDKLKNKATDELRSSKCGWNDEAVAARAQKEIDFKKARMERRVESKRIQREVYEMNVGANM